MPIEKVLVQQMTKLGMFENGIGLEGVEKVIVVSSAVDEQKIAAGLEEIWLD